MRPHGPAPCCHKQQDHLLRKRFSSRLKKLFNGYWCRIDNTIQRFAVNSLHLMLETNVKPITTLRSPMNAIVVVAASEGGLAPLRHIIAMLPAHCTGSLFVVMHIGWHPSQLPSLLEAAGTLPATFADDGMLVETGQIYVAPPDRHMLLQPGVIRLSEASKGPLTWSAADPLFISAAQAYGHQVIGVVLSGAGVDGAVGLRTIKEHGGTALVQEPDDAAVPAMPWATTRADHPHASLPIGDIAQCVSALCMQY